MGREIELKLEIAPGHGFRLAHEPWLVSAGCRSRGEVSTYFDTADRRLRNHGYSLRVRSAGNRFIQTAKSLGGGAGLFDRGEWECEIDSPEPDLGKLEVTPLRELEIKDLQPIIRSEVNRTACRVAEAGADIELDLDEGVMSAGGRQMPIAECEIELLRGEPQAAVALARRIAGSVPVKLGVLSKAERGFALADGSLSKASKAGSVPVRAGMTIAEGFETIVQACIRHFRLNEPLVIERRTMDTLHQSRVAMRRLRSAFTLFRPAILDEESARIREGLRWFTNELGEARNLDVYLQRELPDAEREALLQKREAAYDAVIAAMDSDRFRLLMLDTVAWAALGKWRRDKRAGRPLEPFVNRRIDRLWGSVSAAGHLRSLDDEQRHQLRIQIKKLRYALEFVQVLHADRGDRRKPFADEIEGLQEELGHLNDIVTARSLVTADEWPIARHPVTEREKAHLRRAQRSLRKMRQTGPYWAD